MANPQATQLQPTTPPKPPMFVEAQKLFEEMENIYTNIAKRAFDFFDQRGRVFGHELEDWFRAETEFLRRIPIEIAETENEVNIRAEVPGFTEKDIQVSVEANRLILKGKVEEKKEEKQDEKVVLSEHTYKDFLRSVELPSAVIPDQVKATLKDGILNLTMPKAVVSQPVKIEIKTE